MAVFLAVTIGCIIGIGSLLRILSSRKRKRIERIKQRYSERRPPTAPGPTEPKPKAAACPQRSAKDQASFAINLDRLEPPPEGVHIPGGRPSTRDVPEPILRHANKVSGTLLGRKAILKGVRAASQEPRELTKVVLRDPALAGQVLKTVNSAFYGLRYPLGSVFRAVLLLGHVEVRNIIWRSCVGEALGPQKGPTSGSLDAIWQHSFAASRIAYALARSLGLSDPDEISTTALLHDIGKILYLQAQPFTGLVVYGTSCFSDHQRLEAEQAELSLSHATVGHEIARIWGLPRESCEAIALHHEPSYSDPEEIDGDPRKVALIYVADILCHYAAMQGARDQKGKIYLPRDGWLKILGAENGLEALCTESVIRAMSLQNRSVDEASLEELAVPA